MSQSTDGTTRLRWQIIGLLMAYSFMSWFNRVSMAVAYDSSIQKEFGISATAIGTVYSTFFLIYMLFMTPGGWFIDRFGPDRQPAQPPTQSPR